MKYRQIRGAYFASCFYKKHWAVFGDSAASCTFGTVPLPIHCQDAERAKTSTRLSHPGSDAKRLLATCDLTLSKA